MKSLIVLLSLPLLCCAADYLVYAGTFTTSTSKGIYGYRFNTSSGKLTSLGLVAESTNPAFLIESPSHRFLYAANERGKDSNTVSAYAIDRKTGRKKWTRKSGDVHQG